jgi:hypothetical protein
MASRSSRNCSRADPEVNDPPVDISGSPALVLVGDVAEPNDNVECVWSVQPTSTISRRKVAGIIRKI